MPNANIPKTELIKLVRIGPISGEEKKTTYHEKLTTWSFREREEEGGLDGDGSTSTEKI